MRSVPAIAVGIWLGVMGFFAFIAAPAAFGTLEREAAGRFVSAVFPRYYLLGVVLGLLALLGLLGDRVWSGGRPGDWLPTALLLAMLAISCYAWFVLLPAAHAAREGIRQGPAHAVAAHSARSSRLPRRSWGPHGAPRLAAVAFGAIQAARRP